MIISISGKPGSGKSTVAKMLASRLGYRFYSIGDLRGKIAMKMGITIDELNKIGEKEEWTDKTVDEYQKKLGKKEDDFVIDGRLAFYFIPHSFKVFLDVNLDVAAKRIYMDQRPDEIKCESIEDVKKMLVKRMESDRRRYIKYYNVDFLNLKHYDIVINTTYKKPQDIVDTILKKIGEIV